MNIILQILLATIIITGIALVIMLIIEHKLDKHIEKLYREYSETRETLKELGMTEEEIAEIEATWNHYCFKEESWNDNDFIEESLREDKAKNGDSVDG